MLHLGQPGERMRYYATVASASCVEEFAVTLQNTSHGHGRLWAGCDRRVVNWSEGDNGADSANGASAPPDVGTNVKWLAAEEGAQPREVCGGLHDSWKTSGAAPVRRSSAMSPAILEGTCTSANSPERAVRLYAGITVISDGVAGNASTFSKTLSVFPMSA